MGIKFINVVLLPILVVLLSTVLIFLSSTQIEQLNHLWEHDNLSNILKLTHELLDSKVEILKVAAGRILSNQEILDAFKNQDRDKLAELVLPIHKEFSEKYGLGQIHFHTLGPRSFFRSNVPDKYGDLLDYRKDVIKVQQTKNALFNFSPGKVGTALRYIFPIMIDGELLGSAEVSFIIDSKFLQRLPGEAILYNFLDEYGNPVEIIIKPEGIEDFSKKYPTEILKLIKNGVEDHFNDGRYFYIALVLKDAVQNKPFAAILQRFDGKEIFAQIRKTTIMSLALSVGISLIILLVTIYLGINVTKKVKTLTNYIDYISRTRDLTGIDKMISDSNSKKYSDEVSIISNSIGRTLLTLRNALSQFVKSAQTVSFTIGQMMRNVRETSFNFETFNRTFQYLKNIVEQTGKNVKESFAS
ncbi:MAG: cache domain-containing protein, partial [Fervidobacterium sp.]